MNANYRLLTALFLAYDLTRINCEKNLIITINQQLIMKRGSFWLKFEPFDTSFRIP